MRQRSREINLLVAVFLPFLLAGCSGGSDGRQCDADQLCAEGSICVSGRCLPVGADADGGVGADADGGTGADADGGAVGDAGGGDSADAGAETDGDAHVGPDGGAETDAADSECPYIEEPEPVSDSPLGGEVPPGRSESTMVDGYTDEYLSDRSDYIKVGVRREWGGTIVFYGLADGSPGMNGTNTIDANDTGREVQVAFYDPDRAMQNCAWNASCRSIASSCLASITYLGWNPVQGGNRCNHGSGVDGVSNSSGVLQIVTTPLQWNPNWDNSDCDSSGCSNPSLAYRESDVRLYQTLRFVRTHVVELRYTVENLAATDHAATLQEMPTMYTANGNGGPDLWRLFDAGGTEVAIDTPSGNADGFYYENFESPGPWASLQNDDASYGVGILYENGLTSFQGWQKRSIPFNNVRARFSFGIPASGVVNARAYLIVGSLPTISAEAGWLEANLAPFGVLDQPVGGATVSGETAISGWALDNRGVVGVEARIDESAVVPLTCGVERPDVCRAWPGYPGCNAVGFTGSYDFGEPTSCPHLLEIVATDTDGNQRALARTLVTAI